MHEQIRCGLSYDTLEEFRSAWTALKTGTCFVPWPDAVEPGRDVAVDVLVVQRARVELAGKVDRAGTDEKGNIGLFITFTAQSLEALTSLNNALRNAKASADVPEIFRTARFRKTQTLRKVPTNSGTIALDEVEEPLLEPGMTVEDRFRIEAHVATGGMGEVYRAAHVHLKRPVALKLMRRSLATDQGMWARFQQEAELVSRLESPNIVRVFDFGRTAAGQPFLAMEFVEGSTLDALVSKGPLAAERAVTILEQVCEGLEEAHGMGVVHRDLKPPNIILGKKRDGTEVAKILDFGIARMAVGDELPRDTTALGEGPLTPSTVKNAKLTQLGVVIGTPAYLSPEQAAGAQLDGRTDIYSLGCVAYELLTGQPPFLAETVTRIVEMQVHEPPKPLTESRADLVALPALSHAVMKALAKRKEDRFQTAREFAKALRASLAEVQPTKVNPSTPWAQPDPSVDEAWPPQASPPLAASPPRGVAAPPVAAVVDDDADDFFAMSKPQARSSPVKQAAPVSAVADQLSKILAPGMLDSMVEARASLSSDVTRCALVRVEVLGPAAKSPLWFAGMARVLETARVWGASIDLLNEHACSLLFQSGDLPGAIGRAGLALIAIREAVLDESHRLGLGATTVRGVVVGGSVQTPTNAPADGEIVDKASALLVQLPPNIVAVDRAASEALADVLEVKSLGNIDALELTARKTKLKRPSSTLLGRDAIMASLERRLTSVVQGVVAPVVVRAEHGSGRSALTAELAHRARQKGIVVGIARPSDVRTDLGAVTEMLCMMCGIPTEQRASQLKPMLESLKVPPEVIAATLVITGVSQWAHSFTAGQVAHALRTVMQAGAPERCTLLLFDGLDSMDSHSVEVFAELLVRPGAKELTIGFSTPDFHAERLSTAPTIDLPPLTVAEVTQWLQAQLEAKPSSRLIETLATKSRGMPGMLVDWLALFDDRGQLRRRGDAIGLVDDVIDVDDQSLVYARLAAIPLELRRIIEAAALLGETFDPSDVATVWPKTTAPLFQRVAGSRFIRSYSGKRWTFASRRHFGAVVRALSPERRNMHARRAAVLVEHAKSDPASVDTADIARHFAYAGDGVRAASLWKHSTESAIAQRRFVDAIVAIRGWTQSLALLPNASPEIARARVDALSRAAGIALSLQDASLARTLVDDAAALARSNNAASAELWLSLARVLRSEARQAKAVEALANAEVMAGQSPILALIEAERGEMREVEGDLSEAIMAFERALSVGQAAAELGKWHGEVELMARIEARLAGVYVNKQDFAAARRLLESSASRYSAAGWPIGEARSRLSLGVVLNGVREHALANQAFESAARAAAIAGDMLLHAHALLQSALSLRHLNAPNAPAVAAGVRRLAIALGWEEGRAAADRLAAT